MEQHTLSQYTKHLDDMMKILEPNDGSTFLFANSKRLTHSLMPKLEDKLDASNAHADVLHVHGSLDKTKKFNLIKIFVSKLEVKDFHPRVLIGTSDSNLGIDKSDLRRVQIYEWPEDVGVFGQWRGRAGRNGEECECYTTTGLVAYTAATARIYC